MESKDIKRIKVTAMNIFLTDSALLLVSMFTHYSNLFDLVVVVLLHVVAFPFDVSSLSNCCFLSMQPLDVILSQDQSQVVALLEYVRYDFQPRIQQSSIKIMNILR